MIEVNVTYKGEDHVLQVPSKVDDLSQNQFKWYCKLVVINEQEPIPYRKFLKKTLGVPETFTRHITNSECVSLFNSIGILNDVALSAKSFYPKSWFWRPPKSGMSKLTFYQFTLADEAYIQCLNPESSGRKMQARMFAALYTPFGVKWSNTTAWFAQMWFKIILTAKANRMLTAYGAQAQWIRSIYPESFSGKKSSGRSFGYRGMLVSISGPKFGSVDRAKFQNVHDVLTDIEQTILQSYENE